MSSTYDIIIKPIVTEKSNLELGKNRYTFLVAKTATKIDIRNAVQKLYDVKVAKVNTVIVKGKERRVGRFIGQMSDWKKAVVYLKAGQKIESLAG
jgi:large subunit ribosomal protein L23